MVNGVDDAGLEAASIEGEDVIIESDRNIEGLGKSNQQLSGIFFIVAAILGVLIFAFTQFGGNDAPAVQEAQTFSPPPLDAQRLPEIQPADIIPDPVLDENAFELPDVVDPLELERMRQRNALELEQLRQVQLRLQEEQDEMMRRRRSELVIMDGGEFSLLSDEPVQELSPAEQTLQRLQQSQLEFASGLNASQQQAPESEVYANSQSRFLRDAGDTEVQSAVALRLPNQDTLITQGTFISGVLETAINSDLPGMVRAVVDTPVYSRTGRLRVIPKGSKLIGMYQSGITRGQTRVFVVWTRLERPDGVVIDLGSPGSDALGRAGLGGDVDNHFFQIYGASAFLSVLAPATTIAVDELGGGSRAQTDIAVGAGQSFNETAEIALEASIDIPPTITVDQGARINIFVAKDLSFENASFSAR